MLDFKVYKGTSIGAAIFADQQAVLLEYTDHEFITMGITDTTGCMGKLAEHLRDEGFDHGYCFDHNCHLTAIKAFDGMY